MFLIHPYIHFLFLLLSNFGSQGICWSLSQLSRGERWVTPWIGTPWIGRQHIAGLTLKDKFPLTHTYGQFRLINSPDKHVFELWEETGVSGENPHKHRENMQTPHRKGRSWDSNPKPFCCEATALTTGRLCFKSFISKVRPGKWKKAWLHVVCCQHLSKMLHLPCYIPVAA